LLDAFLQQCALWQESDFPVTEQVVSADTHLTDACWKSFRRRVEDKGCKPKRREATFQERLASKDKHKGKLYGISVTCPVHPTKVQQAKEQARLEAAHKAEQARLAREEKERLAALHKAQVKQEYAHIVQRNTEEATSITVSVPSKDVLSHAQGIHDQRSALGLTQASRRRSRGFAGSNGGQTYQVDGCGQSRPPRSSVQD
jgi:hypothetical protein